MAKGRHRPAPKKLADLAMRALPCGGFLIAANRNNYGFDSFLAAFTSLDDALEWLRTNVERPAALPAEKSPPVARAA